MSILDRHPAPWKRSWQGYKRYLDANGKAFETDVHSLAAELAAARAENERLRERIAELERTVDDYRR